MKSSAPPSVRPAKDDHIALRLWLRLLNSHNVIEKQLRRALQQQCGMTLPQFDLMAQLVRHPEGLRMRQLSNLLMVTGGNVTGIADRLVRDGLIARKDDPQDRRICFIVLTAKGQAKFAEMAVLHEKWVKAIFKSLNPDDQNQLYELLLKLQHSAEAITLT